MSGLEESRSVNKRDYRPLRRLARSTPCVGFLCVLRVSAVFDSQLSERDCFDTPNFIS
jgi:hypothetical protein